MIIDKLGNLFEDRRKDERRKIDIKVEGFSADTVVYEVYHPITKEQLNLQCCDKE